MKLIAGLGNPGQKYENSRHNVGRMVIEEICRHPEFTGLRWERLDGAEVCKVGDLILARAGEGSFMNESGTWLKKLRDFYKIANENVIVVYDDLDLEVGRVKMGSKGPQVHNGVNDVIEMMGEGWIHVRCGVDDRGGDRILPGSDYVLGEFPDVLVRDKLVSNAVHQVLELIGKGV